MLFLKRPAILFSLLLGLLPLTSCADSPLASNLERSLAADPRLENSPAPLGTPDSGSSNRSNLEAQPPADFPSPAAQSPDVPPPLVQPSGSPSALVPQPGDPDFIGPVIPPNLAAQTNPETPSGQESQTAAAHPLVAQTFRDIDQAPEELRRYVEDLAKLGALSLTSSSASSSSPAGEAQLKPNQVITRREYARWLVAANNLLYGDRPAQKIRLGVSTDQPAFQDVPRSDPDFAAIQGLAEAGLIPSPLSGSATTVTFRPDTPLTRENLILWKTPIDTRQTLPNATVEAVQQTWGFQDAARIDPRALRAALADFQNGDLSNIRRAFGYTTLFQPKKTVTRAEAAAALWYFGAQGEGTSAQDILKAQQ